MPFTLFLARLVGLLAVALFVGALLGLRGLMDAAALGAVWLTACGAPVFALEALGFLRRAARYFFGATD